MTNPNTGTTYNAVDLLNAIVQAGTPSASPADSNSTNSSQASTTTTPLAAQQVTDQAVIASVSSPPSTSGLYARSRPVLAVGGAGQVLEIESQHFPQIRYRFLLGRTATGQVKIWAPRNESAAFLHNHIIRVRPTLHGIHRNRNWAGANCARRRCAAPGRLCHYSYTDVDRQVLAIMALAAIVAWSSANPAPAFSRKDVAE